VAQIARRDRGESCNGARRQCNVVGYDRSGKSAGAADQGLLLETIDMSRPDAMRVPVIAGVLARFGRRRSIVMRAAFAFLVMAGLMPSNEAAGSDISRILVASPKLGREMPVAVYRPDIAGKQGCLPLLILLHGLFGKETDWLRLGGIRATLDGMIAEGRLKPLIAVMPGVGDSWYVNSAEIGGPGDYEDAIIGDLLPAIEAKFPVCRTRRGRAIAGLSMGGYGALRLALAHPDLFGAAASLSGALWQNVPSEELDLTPERIKFLSENSYFHKNSDQTVTVEVDRPNPGRHFAGVFGTPFDARRFNRLNPFTLFVALAAARRPVPHLYLTVGDDDSHQLWRGAIAFFDTAREEKVQVDLRITDGDHNWALWRRSIVPALAYLDQHLAAD
jgi:S-formylglutathione hydrolase FrmB